MWRALFFLGGLFLLLQGGIALGIEQVTVHDWAAARMSGLPTPMQPTGERVVALPAWLAPTLVATGGVTLMYAIALPAKKSD